MELLIIIQVFYLLLPAGFANMAPLFIRRWFSFLDFPIDFNIKFCKKPLFGRNKTFRGVIFAILFAIAIAYIQKYLNLEFLELISYDNALLIGLLSGFGAMIGDIAESFIKRRIDLKPGTPLIFFDQTDWVIGTLLLLSIAFEITWIMVLSALITYFITHIIVKHIGYILKIDKSKW